MSKNTNIHVLSRAVILDQGHILLCKTLDLDPPFYFLPGGHIDHEESAEKAVIRELQEEAGVLCEIKRFLGALEFRFDLGHNSICHNHEYNFIFEVISDELHKDKGVPQIEKHIKLLWVPLEQLNEIDFRAEPLREWLPKWLNGNEQKFVSVME